MKIKQLCIFLLLLSAFNASSQIANIENKRKAEREEGLSGSLDINFSYVKNVDEIFQFGGNGRAYYFKDRHAFMLLLESSIIKADAENLVNNNFEHFRYNYDIGEKRKVAIEAFEQLQQNRVQNIELRMLLGSGLRFKVVNEDSLVHNIGVSGMYEYEEAEDSTLTEMNFRGSTYISLDWQISKNFGINFISYYQPLFRDFCDYRISSEFAARIKISEKLNFTARINLLYDNRPLPGIPNNIINISNGIRYSF